MEGNYEIEINKYQNGNKKKQMMKIIINIVMKLKRAK